MSERSWMIGRAPDCDVVIENPIVSTYHCRLTLSPEGLLLDDLKSANGTYVNGARVAEPVLIFPEDQVTLGKNIPFPWPEGALPTTCLVPQKDIESAHA